MILSPVYLMASVSSTSHHKTFGSARISTAAIFFPDSISHDLDSQGDIGWELGLQVEKNNLISSK